MAQPRNRGKDRKPSDEEIQAILAAEISNAGNYDKSELRERRIRAMEYYLGNMRDTLPEKGRSEVVSKDVADVVGWMMPSIMRVFASSDNLGTFEPSRPGDEQGAQQATDYINHVFWKDHNGYRMIWDATFDALTVKNGIFKHWWDPSEITEISTHSGLSDDEFTALVSSDDVEVLEHSESSQTIDDMLDETGEPITIPTHDVKIERITDPSGRMRLTVIPRENFLIDDVSVRLDEDTRFCCHWRDDMTRSDLIELGFDKETAFSVPAYSGHHRDEEKYARQDDGYKKEKKSHVDKSMELVEVHECYLMMDIDGSGVAQRIQAWIAGGPESGTLMRWELWDDDLPFSDLVAERISHRFEGRCPADDTMDIQRIKTVLQREALNNIYAVNRPLAQIEENTVKNPNTMISRQFGGVVIRKQGAAPIMYDQIPFTADQTLGMADYFDREREARTGVSRQSMGVDPDVLQNQTAEAVRDSRDASSGKVELICRNFAEMGGFKRLFKCMLRLYVKHQDKPKVFRLRDEWIEVDPRHWNASMDVTVNTGLGTGSRDRDMLMLNQVLGHQTMITDRLAGTGFSTEAIEMIPYIQNTLFKIAESAGLKSPEEFYPEVPPEKVEQMKQQAAEQAQGPSEAEMKAEAEMQKQQVDAQLKQAEMEQDAALRREQMMMEFELKREQMAAEMQLKREQMAMEVRMKAEASAIAASGMNGGISNVRLGGDMG